MSHGPAMSKAPATYPQLRAAMSKVIAERDELAQAVRTILRGFDEHVFVWSIDGDTRPDWAIRLFPFIRAIGKAQELVGGTSCLGEDCPIHGGPNPEGR